MYNHSVYYNQSCSLLLERLTLTFIFVALYVIEFQKRGLPHSHILLWLCQKIRPDEIDLIISAEIPDQQQDPELFNIIKRHMIHGPCGYYNQNSVCMLNNKCSKKFPRKFVNETQTDKVSTRKSQKET